MRINALNVAAQVVAGVLLLGVALATIVVLEDASRALDVVEEQPVDLAVLKSAKQRIGGAVGLVAIIAGGGLLAFLVMGAWAGRHVVAPLGRLERTVEAIADGHLQRRVDETSGLGELAELGANVNSIVDRLRRLERTRDADALLTRAAIEHLIESTGRGGAVLDTGGRLIAANDAVRDRLAAEQCKAAALLGRDDASPPLASEVEEVHAAGSVRGYVAWI